MLWSFKSWKFMWPWYFSVSTSVSDSGQEQLFPEICLRIISNYLCESCNRSCSSYPGIYEWTASYFKKRINGSSIANALFINRFIFRSDSPLASFKWMLSDNERFVFAETSMALHLPENKKQVLATAHFNLFPGWSLNSRELTGGKKTGLCLKKEKYRNNIQGWEKLISSFFTTVLQLIIGHNKLNLNL